MPDLAVVCDDDPDRIQRWVGDVHAHLDSVQPCTRTDLVDLIDRLTVRAETARLPTPAEAEPPSNVDVDNATYLFIDFDLTPDRTSAAAEEDFADYVDQLRGRTGERLAYLARTHSTAGYIVVVNQGFKHPTFDLTMQKFSLSIADLNIAGADLKNPALWTGASDTPDGFNPWSWPVLTRAGSSTPRFRDTVADLSAPILDTLKLDRRRFHSRQLDVFTVAPETATFADLVGSPLGLDPKDEPSGATNTTVAASVLSRWIDQVVAAQNVVTDLPHLLARFPTLGTADLFASADLKNVSSDAMPATLAENRHDLSRLLGRDVWDLETVRRLATSADASYRPEQELAFCEDTSRFTPLDDCREINTDLPGPYARRFIRRLGGLDYQPFSRLLG